jgi:hypothetical protein
MSRKNTIYRGQVGLSFNMLWIGSRQGVGNPGGSCEAAFGFSLSRRSSPAFAKAMEGYPPCLHRRGVTRALCVGG